MSGLYMWTSDLSIGVKTIDSQHQEMLHRYNILQSAVAAKNPEHDITKTIEFLAEYTFLHFRAEEEIMKANEFPGYPEHKQKHDEFTSTVMETIKELEAGETDAQLTAKMTQWLGDWIVHHIRQMDQEIGKFLREK